MTKNIDKFVLPDDVIALMKEKQKQSTEKNKEIGFVMCARKADNIIEAKNIVEGFPEKVYINSDCPKEYNLIGGFHTHPGGGIMAGADLLVTCDHIADCIGVEEGDKIKCFIRKKNIDPIDCTKEFSEYTYLNETPLKKVDEEIKRDKPEMLKLSERLDILIKQKRTRKADIEERDIRKKVGEYNKKVGNYNKEVLESTEKLKRLQDKFFDDVEF